MRDRIGPDLASDLDLAFRDEGPRDRGAQQLGALIERVGVKHREDEVAHKLIAQIVDKDLARAEQPRLAPRRLEFLALAEVGGKVTTSQR